MTRTEIAGVPVWRPMSVSGAPWVRALVSTRIGGTSAPPYDSLNLGLSTGDEPARVHANRTRLFDALGLHAQQVTHLSQVHGRRVWRVPDSGAREGDAMWTTAAGVVLAVGVADCVPAFVWDTTAPRLALVHAGWRGTAAGILAETISILRAAGAHVAELRVALGPSIGPCCYAVDADVASRFRPEAVRSLDGKLSLDLRLANRLQAESMGLGPSQIDAEPPCTACDPATYYSHRRDGPRTGRMWALAWLCEAPPA